MILLLRALGIGLFIISVLCVINLVSLKITLFNAARMILLKRILGMKRLRTPLKVPIGNGRYLIQSKSGIKRNIKLFGA